MIVIGVHNVKPKMALCERTIPFRGEKKGYTKTMAMKTIEIREGQKPTKEQIKEIRAASKLPDVFDEDCPEFTAEQLSRVQRCQLQSFSS